MKKFLCIGCFILSLSMFFYLFGMALNLTPSLPKGVYRKIDKELAYGDIVKFCLPKDVSIKVYAEKYLQNGFCENGSIGLLKIVLAQENDSITIENDMIFIKRQDKKESIALRKKDIDSKGEKTVSLLKNGIIPKNKVFVYSQHEGSFDSRYFGLLDKDILTVVKEVFVF